MAGVHPSNSSDSDSDPPPLEETVPNFMSQARHLDIRCNGDDSFTFKETFDDRFVTDEDDGEEAGYLALLTKHKKKAERLLRNKKYSEAFDLFSYIFGIVSYDDDIGIHCRAQASKCLIHQQRYSEGLDLLRFVFQRSPEKLITSEMYSILAFCLLFLQRRCQAICAVVIGLRRFKESLPLKKLLESLSVKYPISLRALRSHLEKVSSFGYNLDSSKDVFILLESLPDDDHEPEAFFKSVSDLENEHKQLMVEVANVEAQSSDVETVVAETPSDPPAPVSYISRIMSEVDLGARSYRAGSYSMAAHEFSLAIQNAPELESFEKSILVYCQCMAYLRAKSLDQIRSSLALLEGLASNEDTSSGFVFYGLARYLMALKKSKADVEEVIEKGRQKCSSERKWPFEHLVEIFPESESIHLNSLFDGLASDLVALESPDAVCRHEDCLQLLPGDLLPARNVIYKNDIDFRGYYALNCAEKCSVEFHAQCWKHLKEEEWVSNDKDFLGRECLTPDCESLVVRISITKESGETKEIVSEETSSAAAPSRWKSRKSFEGPSHTITERTATPPLYEVVQPSNKTKKAAPFKKEIVASAATGSSSTVVVDSVKEADISPVVPKSWPPDPNSVTDFIMPDDSVKYLNELDELEMQSRVKQLVSEQVAEEISRIRAPLEKEKADLAKKLEETKVHSKRQAEEISRLKADLNTEQQTTTRLLHKNEQLSTDISNLKKNLKSAELKKDFVFWQTVNEESAKYLRLLDYLFTETFLEGSPTLRSSILEYNLIFERSRLQLEVLKAEVNRDSLGIERLPVGLTDQDLRTMTAEVDTKMKLVRESIEHEARKNVTKEHEANLREVTRSMAEGRPSPSLTPLSSNPQQPSRSSQAASSYSGRPSASSSPSIAMSVPPPTAGGGKLLDNIMQRALARYPHLSRDTILTRVGVIKQDNNNSLKGLTMSYIIERIGTLTEGFEEPAYGAAAAVSASVYPAPTFEIMECAICMEDMKNNSTLMTLKPCGHKFHRVCISSWFKEKRDCPFCRAYVVPPEEFPQLGKPSFQRW